MSASGPILCPVCSVEAEPLVVVRDAVICGHCGASLYRDPATGAVRKSVFADWSDYDAVEMKQLVRGRASIARADRR